MVIYGDWGMDGVLVLRGEGEQGVLEGARCSMDFLPGRRV
jgi:hypothetical protein